MKRHLYYAIAIFGIVAVAVLLSNATHANLDWVRAQYAGAVRCYQVGQEPNNMQVKNKRYFASFEECDKTIGHAL